MAGSKVSKNQSRGKVKELDVKGPLEPRNFVASTVSQWVTFYIEGGLDNLPLALSTAQKELSLPKGTPEELNLKFKGAKGLQSILSV